MLRTVGVEEEFLLAGNSSAMLAPVADAVVDAADRASDGQFERELKQAQAELGSSPQTLMSSLADELRQRRGELASAAAAHGARLIASGTSPIDEDVATTAGDRYERVTAMFGLPARRQLTCGMHVHVSIESPEEGVAVLDSIRDWLAVIRALSANSPFFDGDDTDYASYRSMIWSQWPTAGIAEEFGDVETYESARADLISSGAALDDGMIYFDARLSARYPTVEVRVADVCVDVDDAVVIAALVRALVTTAAQRWAAGVASSSVRSELLRAASWRAARWGVESDLVDVRAGTQLAAWDLVDHLVTDVAPALEAADDYALVSSGLASIRRRGTGARFQRDAYAAGGMSGLVDALAARTLQ